MRPFLIAATVLVTPLGSLSALYTDASQLPAVFYDYVIVGAGNAGNVIANRLTENPKITVLVLEAGVSDEDVFPAIVPFLGPTLTPNTPYDWNYTVAPQAALNNRAFPYPRGKILGGCTTANYMAHQYGSSTDYDKIAADTNDPDWSWSKMQKWIHMHEKFVSPTDGHNTTGQYIPENHGTNGQVSVSLPGNPQSIDDRVMATTQELADEFPYNPDTGGGYVLGMGWVQYSMGGGVRSSSSTSYLRNALPRPNLHVLIHATVMKLWPTGFRNRKTSFGLVQFATSADAKPCFVYATKEIILSAGAIGTPQILLLSGIGSYEELTALNISTIFNNPSVGMNLADHPLVSNIYNVRSSETHDNLLRDLSVFGKALDQWTTNKTGVLANSVSNHYGFFRLPEHSSIFSIVPDPASGPTASHWELIVSNFWINSLQAVPAKGNFLTFLVNVMSPTSRGTVKLASKKPFDKPIIDPKYLSTAFDKFCMREAIKASKRFISASAWSDYIIGPYGSTAATTDEEIDTHIRDNAGSVHHPTGTAAMSAMNALWGVVNPDLKVKGVEGIRIVDASVFPSSPNAHTQGPVYLLAERAADIIASQY